MRFMRRALPASLVVNNNYAISLKLPHLLHIANFHDNAYVSTISCVTAEVFLQSSNFMQEKNRSTNSIHGNHRSVSLLIVDQGIAELSLAPEAVVILT